MTYKPVALLARPGATGRSRTILVGSLECSSVGLEAVTETAEARSCDRVVAIGGLSSRAAMWAAAGAGKGMDVELVAADECDLMWSSKVAAAAGPAVVTAAGLSAQWAGALGAPDGTGADNLAQWVSAMAEDPGSTALGSDGGPLAGAPLDAPMAGATQVVSSGAPGAHGRLLDWGNAVWEVGPVSSGEGLLWDPELGFRSVPLDGGRSWCEDEDEWWAQETRRRAVGAAVASDGPGPVGHGTAWRAVTLGCGVDRALAPARLAEAMAGVLSDPWTRFRAGDGEVAFLGSDVFAPGRDLCENPLWPDMARPRPVMAEDLGLEDWVAACSRLGLGPRRDRRRVERRSRIVAE